MGKTSVGPNDSAVVISLQTSAEVSPLTTKQSKDGTSPGPEPTHLQDHLLEVEDRDDVLRTVDPGQETARLHR